jgi:uracil-DNA glycosylase
MHVFQKRMKELFETDLKLDLYEIPASNLVFVRSPRKDKYEKAKFKEDSELCWSKFHEKIIKKLDIKIVICLGNTPGNFVIKKLNMNKTPIETLEERNDRKWRTKVYENDQKQKVIVIPHPSVSDWTTKECNPLKIISKYIK